MRLALVSDIHGNSLALDAVLSDIKGLGGVDEYWVLGDLCAIGHDPVGVLERLAGLPKANFVRGNTDRFLVTGNLPPPPEDDVDAADMIEGFRWTTELISAAGWFEWVAQLPLELRLELPGGSTMLAVHASPGSDSGSGINPDQSDEEVWELLCGCGADLVVVGHTHVPLDRTVQDVRAFNPGSVSNPPPTDLRAKYAILEADTEDYRLTRRLVDYDRQAVLDALAGSDFPAARYVSGVLRGDAKWPGGA